MKEQRRHNSTFAIGGVSFSADSFVVVESFGLRINICGKNPAHRKSAKRCFAIALLRVGLMAKQRSTPLRG